MCANNESEKNIVATRSTKQGWLLAKKLKVWLIVFRCVINMILFVKIQLFLRSKLVIGPNFLLIISVCAVFSYAVFISPIDPHEAGTPCNGFFKSDYFGLINRHQPWTRKRIYHSPFRVPGNSFYLRNILSPFFWVKFSFQHGNVISHLERIRDGKISTFMA